MKRLTLAVLLLGLGLVIGAVLPSQTRAQNAPVTSTQAVPTDSKTELNARLEERKAKQTAKPSAAESTRLAARCQAAQQKIDALSKKASAGQQPFKEKYEGQQARLQSVQQQLKTLGADTTKLDAAINEVNQKYQAWVDATTAYNLSISDLKAVDCKADPVAFKATLQSARGETKALHDLRVALHAYIKGPLHDALKEAKASLQTN